MEDDEGEKLDASGQAGELRDVTWSGSGKAQARTPKLKVRGQAERLGSPLPRLLHLQSLQCIHEN